MTSVLVRRDWDTDTHRGKTRKMRREKTASEAQERPRRAKPASSSVSGVRLRNHEEGSVCCLGRSACGTAARQPVQPMHGGTRTPRQGGRGTPGLLSCSSFVSAPQPLGSNQDLWPRHTPCSQECWSLRKAHLGAIGPKKEGLAEILPLV